jgi:hypothetical protein
MKVPISYDLIKDLDEGLRAECLLAFQDFCLDLFGEEFGRIPQEEEIDPHHPHLKKSLPFDS